MTANSPPAPAADAFYERISGDRFRSLPTTVGPWSPQLQHGGPPAALLAHVIERLDPRPGARFPRISVDILGPVPVAEIEIAAEIIRPGKRIELISAVATAGGRPALRATAWQVQGDRDRCPEAGPRSPAPPLPDAQRQVFFRGQESFGYAESLEWRFHSGAFHELGPATVWTRTKVDLVHGERTSALCRLLTMVDAANGVSAELPYEKWSFVPVDLTVVIHRDPEGEWIGMRAATTIEPDGIGITRTDLFDARGSIGGSLHTLFVTPR